MASALAEKTCAPCRGGVPPLTSEEAEGYRAQAPDWALVDDATRIERRFRFKDFREAFAFVARAAELAEVEGHHPDIGFGWGYATVSLRTKRIKGLHENDSSWPQSSTASWASWALGGWRAEVKPPSPAPFRATGVIDQSYGRARP